MFRMGGLHSSPNCCSQAFAAMHAQILPKVPEGGEPCATLKDWGLDQKCVSNQHEEINLMFVL